MGDKSSHGQDPAPLKPNARPAPESTAHLHRKAEELRNESRELARRLNLLRSISSTDRRGRLAALNLIEDAEAARRRIEAESAERAQAQRSLRQSEARLATALAAGRMATWDWNVETDNLIASENMGDLLGLNGGTCVTGAEKLAIVLPEDRPKYRGLLDRARRERIGWHTEYRIVRPRDGRIVWLEERAEHLEAAGEKRHLLAGILWEISERKKTEEALRLSESRLRLIIESAREYAIFSMDLSRNITIWSTGAEQVLGYGENEILGQSGDKIFTREDQRQGAPEQEVNTALREGRAVDERWHVRKDGSRFWGSGVLMAMRDNNERVLGFVKVLRDHTGHKEHEEALAASRKKLEEAFADAERAREEAENANRAKDVFLAALSHELRTPLMPVMMTVESLLKQPDLPPRVRKGLLMIGRNVDLETHFINDLLDLTRVARGKFDLLQEPVDLHAVITAALEVCAGDLQGKQQNLSVKLEAAESTVMGDAARLQQVLWNLLKNASKFTANGGHVSVISWNEAQSIYVAVRDNGIGIEPDKLSEVFEPFRQANAEIRQQYGGLGLGLAISKATIENLGGQITAQSDGPGRGSAFTFCLPLPTEEARKKIE